MQHATVKNYFYPIMPQLSPLQINDVIKPHESGQVSMGHKASTNVVCKSHTNKYSIIYHFMAVTLTLWVMWGTQFHWHPNKGKSICPLCNNSPWVPQRRPDTDTATSGWNVKTHLESLRDGLTQTLQPVVGVRLSVCGEAPVLPARQDDAHGVVPVRVEVPLAAHALPTGQWQEVGRLAVLTPAVHTQHPVPGG